MVDRGWSVHVETEEGFTQMAQYLWRVEALQLCRMLWDRKDFLIVEMRDVTGTTRGYWSSKRPDGFFG